MVLPVPERDPGPLVQAAEASLASAPTRRELSEHTERVGRAVTVIERAGATDWGQE
jgi:hypothetical protein